MINLSSFIAFHAKRTPDHCALKYRGEDISYASFDLPDLTEYCRPRLASFKVPKQLIIRENLPRNPSGKVLKRVLRAELGAIA